MHRVDTVTDLIAEATARNDGRPALLIKPGFRTRRWRYRDIGRQVPRAASVLADAGLAPGDRVLIWAVNRPEWAIGFAFAHVRPDTSLRGDVEVIFGEPIFFAAGTAANTATDRLEEAVAAL
jgi:non-ribosomal peptide synthetase component E (peptide arylation enzyme)